MRQPGRRTCGRDSQEEVLVASKGSARVVIVSERVLRCIVRRNTAEVVDRHPSVGVESNTTTSASRSGQLANPDLVGRPTHSH